MEGLVPEESEVPLVGGGLAAGVAVKGRGGEGVEGVCCCCCCEWESEFGSIGF